MLQEIRSSELLSVPEESPEFKKPRIDERVESPLSVIALADKNKRLFSLISGTPETFTSPQKEEIIQLLNEGASPNYVDLRMVQYFNSEIQWQFTIVNTLIILKEYELLKVILETYGGNCLNNYLVALAEAENKSALVLKEQKNALEYFAFSKEQDSLHLAAREANADFKIYKLIETHYAFSKDIKEKLQQKIQELHSLILNGMRATFERSLKSGKPVLILIGESHVGSLFPGLVEMITMFAAQQFGIEVYFEEVDDSRSKNRENIANSDKSEDLETPGIQLRLFSRLLSITLLPADQGALSLDELAPYKGLQPPLGATAVDARGVKYRNQVIAGEYKSYPGQHIYGIVGAYHLYGLVKEEALHENYELLILNCASFKDESQDLAVLQFFKSRKQYARIKAFIQEIGNLNQYFEGANTFLRAVPPRLLPHFILSSLQEISLSQKNNLNALLTNDLSDEESPTIELHKPPVIHAFQRKRKYAEPKSIKRTKVNLSGKCL